MEIDPLKIPAFMRKRSFTRSKASSADPYLKPSKPKTQKKQTVAKPIKAESVLLPAGVVTHYFDKIKVASIKLGADVEVGMKLQLTAENGPYKQKLKSIQINRENVETATQGQEIGIKVNKKVKVGELVYLVS